jgi:hypothetical protein
MWPQNKALKHGRMILNYNYVDITKEKLQHKKLVVS